jgi:hypothetical protein
MLSIQLKMQQSKLITNISEAGKLLIILRGLLK